MNFTSELAPGLAPSGQQKGVKVLVAPWSKDSHLYLGEADRPQESQRRGNVVSRSSHERNSEDSLHRCPDVTDCLQSSTQYFVLPGKHRIFVYRNVNHQAAARRKNPGALRKVFTANPLIVEVLKNVGRENGRDRCIRDRDFSSRHQVESHITRADVLSRVSDHSVRDIERMDRLEVFGEPAGYSASSAANFNDSSLIHAVALPLTAKVSPIRLPEAVESIIGPSFRAVFLGIGPSSYSVKRVLFAPLNPFFVRG
jgi:hypothetical protein